MRPERTYPLPLPALDDLAKAVSTLDDLAITAADKDLVERCHAHIVRALGRDADLVYLPDEAAA